MANQSVDAIYEHGTLRLLGPLDIEEGQRVHVTVEPTEQADGDGDGNVLDLMLRFFEDVPEDERREIEKIILDRRELFGGRKSA